MPGWPADTSPTRQLTLSHELSGDILGDRLDRVVAESGSARRLSWSPPTRRTYAPPMLKLAGHLDPASERHLKSGPQKALLGTLNRG